MRIQGREVQALLSLQSLQRYLREATDVVGNTINMCDKCGNYVLWKHWELRVLSLPQDLATFTRRCDWCCSRVNVG